jgi:hypothetical protein
MSQTVALFFPPEACLSEPTKKLHPVSTVVSAALPPTAKKSRLVIVLFILNYLL